MADTLTNEEGYVLVDKYVRYYWNSKFFSLRDVMEVEDCVNDVYLKLLRHNHFEKYDSSITTKKYHVCRAVFTSMVDMLRKQKYKVYSLDSEDPETGLSFVETVIDENQRVEETASGFSERDRIIALLPSETTSNIRGYSPLLGREVGIDYRTLAIHLEAGYTVKDLSLVYRNPRTGEHLSEGSVSRYIREMREYCLENIVLA